MTDKKPEAAKAGIVSSETQRTSEIALTLLKSLRLYHTYLFTAQLEQHRIARLQETGNHSDAAGAELQYHELIDAFDQCAQQVHDSMAELSRLLDGRKQAFVISTEIHESNPVTWSNHHYLCYSRAALSLAVYVMDTDAGHVFWDGAGWNSTEVNDLQTRLEIEHYRIEMQVSSSTATADCTGYSKPRTKQEWLRVFKTLGVEMSEDTFKRRRDDGTYPEHPTTSSNPRAQRIQLLLSRLPTGYDDSTKY